MTAKNILSETYDLISEYAEMIDNPSALVAEVLSHRVFRLESKIEYLHKRLDYAERGVCKL